MKKLIFLFIAILGLYSCSNDSVDPDNSKPLPIWNYVFVQFLDKDGNDASRGLEMELLPEKSRYGEDYYGLPEGSYTFRWLLNGQEVPETYLTNDLKEHEWTTFKALRVIGSDSENVKTFEFALETFYGLQDWHQSPESRVYEFDYRFKIPALLGDTENSLKVTFNRLGVLTREPESVTFNGVEIAHGSNCKFQIVVDKSN